MKVILKYLIALCLLLPSIGAIAHSPDVSSTLLVEESPDKWLLQIRAALTAFEYEVEYNFGQSAYATPEEFQELVAKHVREHLHIQPSEGVQAELKNGIVNLGHETSVTFEVTGIPQIIETLLVSNTSFKNIPRNQSALMIVKKGLEKTPFKLDKKNNHKVDLILDDSKLKLNAPAIAEASFAKTNVIGIGLFLAGMLLVAKFIGLRKTKIT